MAIKRLYRVTSSYFVAGFNTVDETVTNVAPILSRWIRGSEREGAIAICEGQGWRVEEVAHHESDDFYGNRR